MARVRRWREGVPHREIVYQSESGIAVVAVETEPTFSSEPPRVLLPKQLSDWDVSLDGERFVIVEATDADSDSSSIVVVPNWLDELKSTFVSLDQ